MIDGFVPIDRRLLGAMPSSCENGVGTLPTDRIAPTLAATCTEPPCRVTPFRDSATNTNVYVHGADANPEHWLRLSDEQIGLASVTAQVHAWIGRVHAWEQPSS